MNKQAWIEKAKELGLESFEIYQSLSASKEMTWYEHAMDTFVTSKILGTSLRGIVDGNVAMIALEQVDDSKMDSVLKQLVDQAKTIQTPEKSFSPLQSLWKKKRFLLGNGYSLLCSKWKRRWPRSKKNV